MLIAGSIVTFGAGAIIQSLVAGFDTSIVTMTGIPLDATIASLSKFLANTNIDHRTFYIVSHDKQKRHCKILVDRRSATQLVDAIGQVEMGGCRLSASLVDAGGGDVLSVDYFLNLWWRAPSARYVATYGSPAVAEAKARELNGSMLHGRRVSAHTYKASSDIVIDGLPASVTAKEVAHFAKTLSAIRQHSKSHDTKAALCGIQDTLRAIFGTVEMAMEDVSRPRESSTTKIRLRLDSLDRALQAHNAFNRKKFSWNGNSPIHAFVDEPVQFKLTIPFREYRAQRKQWSELEASHSPAQPGRHDCFLELKGLMWSGTSVDVTISGWQKEAVGRLKVRVENLARGETLVGGIPGLSDRFLDEVELLTNALIIRDRRTRALRGIGEPEALARARSHLQDEAERLASLEITFFLKPNVAPYFLRLGIPALKEELGEGCVRLRGRSSLVVRGGEVARRAVERHMAEAETCRFADRATGSTCPVCYMEPVSPFRLGCGHEYCAACAKLLLSSATDNKTFPLLCVGDNATCGVPIPIPTIRKFLTDEGMNRLFDAAFAAHVERNPDKVKYCRTAGCEQVYAVTAEQQFAPCPSCFAGVCTACNEDAHTDRTCDEVRRAKDEERLNNKLCTDQNYKRCPNCNILVEKTAGCNHMSCRCGTHFCWLCMQAFPSGKETYDHMSQVHGGFYAGPVPAEMVEFVPVQGRDAERLRVWLRNEAVRQVEGPNGIPVYLIPDEVIEQAREEMAQENNAQEGQGGNRNCTVM
ncbi:uncharacterized protein SCHCODRAFT_02608177 [Schizophyllum commune H4-8]|nr:uncharacterized protein SCHCODRAFT_02608177 [Schizophyllum commune H4-8]KAI5900541.1 hypothetical protein SCHCODRAFT_02608177 [Schizophyllum commune H4-8]